MFNINSLFEKFKSSPVYAVRGLVFVFIFAGIGTYLIFLSFASSTTIASLQAEQMSLPSQYTTIVGDSTADGGKAVKVSRASSIRGSINLPSTATGLGVRVEGTQCKGNKSWPSFNLSVDGSTVIPNTAVQSSSWVYVNNANGLNLAAGVHSVVITGFNLGYGSCNKSLFVDVTNFYGQTQPPPVPTVTISATPTVVSAGSASTLTWTSTNATGCNATGSWGGTKTTSGSQSTGALNQNASYTLTCTGSGGTAAGTATVTVAGGGGGGGVPKHIETWVYDDACPQGKTASAALVRQWVTYAESNCGTSDDKAQFDCHDATTQYCTDLAYLDANKIYPPPDSVITQNSPPEAENWWLHIPGFTDSAHRIYAPEGGGSNILNQSVAAVQSWFQNYVKTNYDEYDALMMDDTQVQLNAQLYNSPYTSSQEITSNAALLAAHQAMANALVHANGQPFKQAINSLQVNPFLTPDFNLVGSPANVIGSIAEGIPYSNGLTPYYSTMLDDMAYVNTKSNGFMVLEPYDDSALASTRRVQEASILLGYAPGHTVSWPDFGSSPSDLRVYPEEGIYPTQPVQTMGAPGGTNCLAGQGTLCTSGGHNDVQVAAGIYRREFATCYNQGTAFGPCAVIMNDSSNAATVSSSWLSQTYKHQITFVGTDVEAGGTVNLSGAAFTAGSTSIPAGDAVLLAP